LNEIKVKHEKEKDKARKELASLTREIASTRNNFRKQRMDLQSQLDEFMSENNLLWKEVNIVHAILKDELNKAGIGERDIAGISKEIAAAGSLSVHISEKQSNMERLRQEEKVLAGHVNSLQNEEKNLGLSVTKKRIAKDFADDELEEKRKRVAEIEQMISDYIEDLTASRLIIEFLASPDGLTPEDFNHLQATISSLRNWRLGAFERVSKAREKNALLRIMPSFSRYMDQYRDKLEKGREQLAYYLLPIFQDKVTFISGYAISRMGKSVSGLRGRL